MDSRLYLDVNHFARQTAWAHGFAQGFTEYGGLAALGLLFVLCWWRSRSAADPARAVAASAWTLIGAVVAVAINQPFSHLVGRLRPYETLHGVEVLVPRAHDFTFPSDHATLASAVIVGMWLSRDRLLAILTTVVGLLLAASRVYVGAHYPSDVVAGLLLGGLVVAVAEPLALLVLTPAMRLVLRTPLRPLVARTRPPSERAADRPAEAGVP